MIKVSHTVSGTMVLSPPTIAAPAPPHTYLGIAQGMMDGVRVLATASPLPSLALALVAAHTLECLLKAYLSRSRSDTAVRGQQVRHDLEKLWTMACADGLRIQPTLPDWAKRLSDLHKSPYHLRYSAGVHGLVTPAPEPMTTELAQLAENVRAQLR